MLNVVMFDQLPFNVSSADLTKWIGAEVVKVEIEVDPVTSRGFGKAKAVFQSVTDASTAQDRLNGTKFLDKTIRVLQLD